MTKAGTPLKARLKYLFRLFEKTGERFGELQGYRLSATFSYFATFAIFPLILLSVTVIGFVIGDDAQAKNRMLEAVAAEGGMRQVLEQTLGAMEKSSTGRGLSAVVVFFSLAFSASGAFTEIDTAFNEIWQVPKRSSNGVWGTIRTFLAERLVGFLLVVGLGLSLLTSLIASAVFGAIAHHGAAIGGIGPVLTAAEVGVSFALVSLMFTLVFHFVPRTRPPIRDVASGAILTAAVLMVLKTVFASYLEKLTSYSAYGIVGGVLGMATWIYLSSMIIFLGATLTRVHCELTGCPAAKAKAEAKTKARDPNEASFADVARDLDLAPHHAE